MELVTLNGSAVPQPPEQNYRRSVGTQLALKIYRHNVRLLSNDF
jgi:hypothetical protein